MFIVVENKKREFRWSDTNFCVVFSLLVQSENCSEFIRLKRVLGTRRRWCNASASVFLRIATGTDFDFELGENKKFENLKKMSVTFDYDSFLLEDQLFGSSGALYSVKTTEVLMDSQSFLSSSMDDSLKFDVNNMLPTPPVSPSRDSDCNKETDDDLDLGLDLLGIDIPGFLTGSDADSQWLFDELFKENGLANANEQDSLLLDSQVRRSEVGELRHDCMWAGTCHEEQEHHRLKKELMLLSTSPNEPLMAAALQQEVVNEEVKVTRIERRTRLDTLGSLRPETPSSLSDSELEAEHLTADSSDDAAVKDEMNSESSSDEESEDEDDKVQANIQPVRNTQQRKNVLANVKCSLKSAVVNSLPDHSYSHSDHSYHTQRRPQNDNLLADQLGIQTPSDSGELTRLIKLISAGDVFFFAGMYLL